MLSALNRLLVVHPCSSSLSPEAPASPSGRSGVASVSCRKFLLGLGRLASSTALSPTNFSPDQSSLHTGHFSAFCMRKKLRTQWSWRRPKQSRSSQRWPYKHIVSSPQTQTYKETRIRVRILTTVIISLQAAQNLIRCATRPSSSSLYIDTNQPRNSISARGLKLK